MFTNSKCPGMALSFLEGLLFFICGSCTSIIIIYLWKHCARSRREHEFTKFQNQLGHTVWIEECNPLYKNPITLIHNPMYRKNST